MKRVFISFKMENKAQVDGVRLMAWNRHLALDFYDESVRIPYRSENAAYIRSRIREKIRRSSVTLGLLKENTHRSEWVDWELQASIEEGNRIVLMGLPGHPPRLVLPKAVAHLKWHAWDHEQLHTLIGA